MVVVDSFFCLFFQCSLTVNCNCAVNELLDSGLHIPSVCDLHVTERIVGS